MWRRNCLKPFWLIKVAFCRQHIIKCNYRNIECTNYMYLLIIKLLCGLSNQKRLQESVELLDRFKQGTLPPGVTDAQVATQKLDLTTTFRIKWIFLVIKKSVFVLKSLWQVLYMLFFFVLSLHVGFEVQDCADSSTEV